MNGVHDMGGMQGLGPVSREENEPVFHARWESRVYAMMRALRARGGAWNQDAFRQGIEQLPPVDYLRMSYYERWFAWIGVRLVQTGAVTSAEIASGRPAPGTPRSTPFVTIGNVSAFLARRASARRPNGAAARFTVGQTVRARNLNPTGHTRLPRYVRGRNGVVLQDRGVFLFPDTNASQQGEKPQHVYSVRFSSRTLWGEQASPLDSVYLDLWDDYLEDV